MPSLRSAFYFAWINLKLRLESESSSVKRLLDRIEENGGLDESLLSEQETKQYQNWQKFSNRLENAMLKLDDSIMLFRDF